MSAPALLFSSVTVIAIALNSRGGSCESLRSRAGGRGASRNYPVLNISSAHGSVTCGLRRDV